MACQKRGKADRHSSVEAKLALLRQRVQDGHYPLHERLPPERILCRELGVSRMSLRKALDALSQEGVIWRHVGKGTFIGGAPGSVHSNPANLGALTTLSDLLEARVNIEPACTRLAALRAEPRHLRLMEQYCLRASEAKDWNSWDEWDDLFHRSLAESGGNAILIGMMDFLLNAKRRSKWCIRNAVAFDPGLAAHYTSQHRKILFYVTKRDGARSEQAMRAHIGAIATSVGPALQRKPTMPAPHDAAYAGRASAISCHNVGI